MKGKPVTILKKIDLNDPNKEKKLLLIQGVNRLSDLMTSIKRDQENITLLITTFFLGVVFSAFFNSIIYYFLFGIILLLFLIFATLKNNRDFDLLISQYIPLVVEGDKLGLNLKQRF